MTLFVDKERLVAELAALDELLEELPEEGYLERLGLESRKSELAAELSALADEPVPREARSALLFGGAPVLGTRGVDARFSGEALTTYQEFVSTIAAVRQLGALRDTGPIPSEKQSHLHITQVLHGSFGFQLEELSTQKTLAATPLAEAVEAANRIIAASADAEDVFENEVAGLDRRAFAALSNFFDTLRKHSANLRLIDHRGEVRFDEAAISVAAQRTKSLRVAEEDKPLPGTFLGVLHGSGRFEHELMDGTIIKGKADEGVDLGALQDWTLKRCKAHVRVVAWERGGRKYNRYTLLAIEPLRDSASEPEPDPA